MCNEGTQRYVFEVNSLVYFCQRVEDDLGLLSLSGAEGSACSLQPQDLGTTKCLALLPTSGSDTLYLAFLLQYNVLLPKVRGA